MEHSSSRPFVRCELPPVRPAGQPAPQAPAASGDSAR
jgi:hypothetical protein